jgi:foldase protein PrsA
MVLRVLKKIAVILLALAIGGAVVAGCGGGLSKSDVAVIGKVTITQDELNKRLPEFESQYFSSDVPDKSSSDYKDFERVVVDYLVTLEIATQKAPSLKVTVTDKDVQDQLDQVKTNYFGGDESQLEAALKQQNVTLVQYKASLREQVLLQKTYDAVTKDVANPTDAEVQAYYDAHKTDYLQAETRNARHILIAPVKPADTSATDSSSTTTTVAPTDADWAKALATANKVRADLVAGADWTAEAKQYSDDTGTKDSGGDLSTITKGEMVPEFDAALFSLKLNEISQPVKTQYGYHVIQVTAITPEKQQTLDEVKSTLQSNMLDEAKTKAWKGWIAATKAELKVTYAQGMEMTTTTTTQETSSTAVPGSSSSTTASSESASSSSSDTTATTAAPATTTTAAQTTTTTAAPTTTTSAAPTTTTAAATTSSS